MVMGVSPNFQTMAMYIEGYLSGINLASNPNIFPGIDPWFQEKNNVNKSRSWLWHIQKQNKGKSDEELRKILLQTFREYAEEKL
ncbi:hypothetical protein BW716_11140 [[Flexibacter] sp. ATCC 35208]|nr:hypothetical protein BW716_11140 [[Flexibacter] sp. ATCC 35208]